MKKLFYIILICIGIYVFFGDSLKEGYDSIKTSFGALMENFQEDDILNGENNIINDEETTMNNDNDDKKDELFSYDGLIHLILQEIIYYEGDDEISEAFYSFNMNLRDHFNLSLGDNVSIEPKTILEGSRPTGFEGERIEAVDFYIFISPVFFGRNFIEVDETRVQIVEFLGDQVAGIPSPYFDFDPSDSPHGIFLKERYYASNPDLDPYIRLDSSNFELTDEIVNHFVNSIIVGGYHGNFGRNLDFSEEIALTVTIIYRFQND